MNFENFLQANGLLPGNVVPDGIWHRCPTADHPRKHNGSYKLAFDARVGFCQDHAVHPEVLVWHPDGVDKVRPIDFDAIARRRTEARRVQVKAIQAARAYYLDCKPLRDGHPYLEAHGLKMDGCHGLKADDGWLVVPVWKDGNLMSVQRISQGGEKKFWTGAPVKAGSYVIERRGAQVLVLCEGLATGLAIFAAVPTVRVIVAFDSGNMTQVEIPRRWLVAIASDNDHETEARIGRNPGLKAAQEAADALGCGVAVPVCRGSDWCDYRNERVQDLLVDRPEDREEAIRRAVDAEISAQIMRAARYLRPA